MEGASKFADYLKSLGLPAQVGLSAATVGALYVAYREATKVMTNARNEPPIDLGLPFLGKTLDVTGDPWKFTRGKSGLWQTHVFGYDNITIVQSCEDSQKVYGGEGRNIDYWFPPHVEKVFGKRALICMPTGETHRKLRGALISCFQPKVLQLTSQPIQDIVRSALDRWESAGVFDAGKEPFKVAFGVGTSFVGLDTTKMPKERQDYLMQKTVEMNLGITAFPIDLGRFSTYGQGLIAANEVRAVMADVINDRRDFVRSLEAAGKPRPDDVLQRLLDLRDEDGLPLDDVVLAENMCLFIFASFETTAATLTSFLTCLARHPEVQEKAYQHIKDVLGEDSEEFRGTKSIHPDRWKEFEYIEQVMREAERTIPPITMSSWREANTSFELGGFKFTKGKKFFVNALERTRDPQYWERPNEFEPERFGPERMEHKRGAGKNNKLNTFGGGTRLCLGKSLANYERMIFGVLALRDYKFSFAEKEPLIQYNLTLRIRGAYPMKIERRR